VLSRAQVYLAGLIVGSVLATNKAFAYAYDLNPGAVATIAWASPSPCCSYYPSLKTARLNHEAIVKDNKSIFSPIVRKEGGARTKLVAVSCAALVLASCASSPQPVGAPGSSGTPESARAPVRASGPEPAKQTARDAFKASMFDAQRQSWTMLCDHDELSVGVRNDASSLFVRAAVWNDGNSALGVGPTSSQPLGDLSVLMIHFGNDTARTAGQDLDVILNPWPEVPGIRMQRRISAGVSTTMQEVEGASGSIRYVSVADGKSVRTDEYELPLRGLGLQRGIALSVAFYALSSAPAFATSCAAGLQRGNFYPPAVPVATFFPLKLL
jgi:hypothetical protein